MTPKQWNTTSVCNSNRPTLFQIPSAGHTTRNTLLAMDEHRSVLPRLPTECLEHRKSGKPRHVFCSSKYFLVKQRPNWICWRNRGNYSKSYPPGCPHLTNTGFFQEGPTCLDQLSSADFDHISSYKTKSQHPIPQ